MSKNNRVIIISLTVAVIIAIFLFITIFAILYFYWGDEAAIKDALSTTGSFFGGFATLGTAIVAAFLVADWKKQATYNSQLIILADMLNDLELLKEEFDRLRSDPDMFYYLNRIIENEDIISSIFLNFSKMHSLINTIRSKYFQLKMLSNQHELFPIEDGNTNIFLRLQSKLLMFKMKSKNIERLRSKDKLNHDDLKLAFFISGELDRKIGHRFTDIERYSISEIYKNFYDLRELIINYKKMLDN